VSDALFDLVPATDVAKNFIFATWLKSYQVNSPFAKGIPSDVFFKGHHTLLERIFERNPVVILATPPGEPDVILGYVVAEPSEDVIHYVYVKPAVRRYGVAKALVEATGITLQGTYTHKTFVLRQIPGITEMTFNPYRLYS
jgi:GNAT superfamily N-acetyltransferase